MQEESSPSIWLIDVVAGRRRLRRLGTEMRADIGMSTLFDARLPALRLDEVRSIEVVAPYAPPAPRLATVLTGAAVAFMLAAGNDFTTGVMLAVTTAAFAVVAAIVALSTPPRQRLARMTMAQGAVLTMAYWTQDEADVRRLFGAATWLDGDARIEETVVNDVERHRIEQMRVGLVLTASAIAIIVLYFQTGRPDSTPDSIGIPYDIIHRATWTIVIGVNAVAWWRMATAMTASRRATRRNSAPVEIKDERGNGVI